MVRLEPASPSRAPEDAPERSRLLDLADCAGAAFTATHREMLQLDLEQQPRWFRPLLIRSRTLKSWTGYDHWSRAWEYPWAVRAADLGARPLRTLDVGGGGSPFSLYLAARGHECWVADPSLDRGASFVFDPERSFYRNLRSLAKRRLFSVAGIHTLWGLPEDRRPAPGGAASGPSIARRPQYVPDPAGRLRFPDAHFDRVFCLSVMEHIPADAWHACMRDLARVLRPGGRLVLTLDMTLEEAHDRRYRRLIEACPLRLAGDPHYEVPIPPADQERRHPGHGYETIGLLWHKDDTREDLERRANEAKDAGGA